MTPGESQSDDRMLVERSLHGDREAFGALVERHAGTILSMTYRMIGNRSEAEDLTQETFLAAFKALSRFRNEARFSTWLYRIGINKCKDWLRARGRPIEELGEESESPDLTDWMIDERTPEQALSQKQLAVHLEQAIQALPVWYREAFVLKHVEGLSYEEMSQILDVGKDTLKMRVYKARIHLRQKLGSLVEEGATLTEKDTDRHD